MPITLLEMPASLTTSTAQRVGPEDVLSLDRPTWNAADTTQGRPRIAPKGMKIEIVDGRGKEVYRRERYENTRGGQKTRYGYDQARIQRKQHDRIRPKKASYHPPEPADSNREELRLVMRLNETVHGIVVMMQDDPWLGDFLDRLEHARCQTLNTQQRSQVS